MSTIVKPIPHTVDLNEPVKKTYIDTLLATEDNLAHRFDITLLQGGQAVAMPSGAAVTAYFIRYSDNATVPITSGAVNGNVASVTLTKACYNKPGQFALIIKVSGGGIVNTVFYGEGTVYTSSTDKVVNDENIVPTLADLLAQIAAMEAGTAAANTATNRANAAANRCEQMQINASGMAGDSNKLNGKGADQYLTVDKVVNNFTTTEASFVADARALKVLNDALTPVQISVTANSNYVTEASIQAYKIGKILSLQGYIFLKNYVQNENILYIDATLPKAQGFIAARQKNYCCVFTVAADGKVRLNGTTDNDYYNINATFIVN